MKKFDPSQARKALSGDVGYQWTLSRSFEESRDVGGLAISASAFLNMAVKCLLVGDDDPATQLLKRAFEWLTAAIEGQEKPRAYAENGTEAQRHHDLAMCIWLLHNVHDAENPNKFVEYEDRFLIGRRDKANMSAALVGYVDAGAYRQALRHFADARLSAARSLNSIRNEGQMCYVICRQRLEQEYLEAAVGSASEKFLRRIANNFLIDGCFLRAAEWMKVMHWSEGRPDLSPREAVLKCYEYLSDVAPPISGAGETDGAGPNFRD